MKVKVLYFSILRDIMGSPEEALDLPEGSTPKDLHMRIKERQPAFLPLSDLRVAQNEKFISNESPLKDGDTVCFISPVAGG